MNNPEINEYGNQYWRDDQRELHHDDDLPAIVWIGNVNCWCFHGSFHRAFGPALEMWNGEIRWWWLNTRITDEN